MPSPPAYQVTYTQVSPFCRLRLSLVASVDACQLHAAHSFGIIISSWRCFWIPCHPLNDLSQGKYPAKNLCSAAQSCAWDIWVSAEAADGSEGSWLHCLALAAALLERIPSRRTHNAGASGAITCVDDLSRQLILPAMQQSSAAIRLSYRTPLASVYNKYKCCR